ncbi:cytochrome b [Aliivibrio kagoshimensis]|uniref:cytochrome b n=1 Tax=Aliivibrio kagoshimensis TaxID=2910230 RepID=UPI003D0A3CA2
MNRKLQYYDIVSKTFHWLSALAIFGLFGLGYWMVDLTYYDEWYKTGPDVHRSIGICLALVTFARMLWKLKAVHPEVEGKPYEIIIAKLVHRLFYVLLTVLFISGYLITTADGNSIEVFNWFSVPGFGSMIENQEDIAGEIHYYLAYTVIGLAVVHALAAIKHHFIDKDKTLIKMIGVNKQ